MTERSTKAWLICGISWAATLGVLYRIEQPRIEEHGLFHLLVSWNSETTFPTLALLILPVLLFLFPVRTQKTDSPFAPELFATNNKPTGSTDAASKSQWTPALQSLVVFFGSMLASSWIGFHSVEVFGPDGRIIQTTFSDLPPTYHDEYSYLLQAETFSAGRLTWPPAPTNADLFHQFHVLNERVTVSRYFPFTGLWIAPFAAIGHPIWAHWIAGALAAVFFFWSARIIMAPRAAILGGLMLAASPGLAIFSNMMLAHHPTMMALSIFLFAFLKLMRPHPVSHIGSYGNNESAVGLFRRATFGWALLSGLGLTAAMLGRPMTAAGFAAPMGLWLLINLIRKKVNPVAIIGFAVPLLLGFLCLGVLNQSATGSPLKSAYQEYTDLYTPRHKFGFNNAVDCEPGQGPEAIQKYDQWAINLDAATATHNLKLRIRHSLFWTWNIAFLAFGLGAAVVVIVVYRFPTSDGDSTIHRFGRRSVMTIGCSIVSLYLVHIPYWYAGILEWHYVFESAPLVLLLTGFGLNAFLEAGCRLIAPLAVKTWGIAILLATLIPAWHGLPALEGVSRIESWISQMVYSKRRISEFMMAISGPEIQHPALILVDESNTDPQLSFIINPPDYQSSSLVCRLPNSLKKLNELKKQFPDRSLYYFDASRERAIIVPFDANAQMKKKANY